eukprot:29326-Pelagococcus_subviridis.AAC.2
MQIASANSAYECTVHVHVGLSTSPRLRALVRLTWDLHTLNLEKRSRAHTHSRAACAAVVNAHTRHGGRGGVPVHEDHGVQDN